MEKYIIYSYSVLYSSSEDFQDKTPYLTTILQKPDGNKFAALIEDYIPGEEIRITQEVFASVNSEGKTCYTLRL